MRDKPVFVVDVDEVLGDFVKEVLKAVECVTGAKRIREEVDQYSIRQALRLDAGQWSRVTSIISEPGFASAIEPFEGAVDGLRRLSEHATVVIATAPWPSQSWVTERREWLTRHFGGAFQALYFSDDKRYLSGDFFVDDKPEHVEDWLEHQCWVSRHYSIQAALWHHHHNAGREVPAGATRTDSWDYLVERARRMAEIIVAAP